ncbi:iron-sulfur cluster-binding protein [Brachyspira hyodysenteriae]|uniref:DUF362 domain-containing protein n=1 Tax=Brachyspira hyodysenteriae TaxID=159 RepID=UPI00063D87E6|nr:DUF362 domain-containing protein [Brachyspira hyodysenteriae]KLI24641.1 iron-sulfur cluster-binding protein [Brachyspira hyodysenteriae]TVL72844.1 iron-sulfur cluster-binding protein [Brachyspira hyodysenteriae]TVL88857.1 iron-sulfur cluster-binding protein [Brachyspira hyodysenteriae]
MSKVAVIKCENYDLEEVKSSIKKAIDLIGGIDLFVKENDKVLLKPNFLAAETAEKSVTTHPVVFEAIVSILQEKTKNISYGDSPGIGKGSSVALKSGIDEIANKLNVKYVDFEEPVGVTYEDGVQEKSFTIAKPIQEADVIISLPKLKSHALTTMTGAVKNQFGCIPGFRKAEYHLKLPDFEDFSTMLLDLNKLVNPKLYIMDGILAMEGNGPRNGNPRKVNALIVSADAVALDYVASQIISFDYNTIPTLKMGFKHGFSDKEKIEVLGDGIESVKVTDFKKPHKGIGVGRSLMKLSRFPIIKRLFATIIPKPVIEKNKCVKCGVCVKVCPVTPLALNFDKKGKDYPPEYYYKNCISCYCCQELCPHKAIVLKRKF